jgi:hypothetical protein
MSKPTYKIEVNYDEAILLSAAITMLLNKEPHPEMGDADIDYIIGQIQDAMETLEGEQ